MLSLQALRDMKSITAGFLSQSAENATFRLSPHGQKVRVAQLQNEIAPEQLLIRYEQGFEKREKKIRKKRI